MTRTNPAVAGSGKLGSLSAVPNWNWTSAILADGSKSAGRPDSSKTTWYLINAFDPVLAGFPVAGLSPKDVMPYWIPPTLTGPCRLLPGKFAAPKRSSPAELIPHLAPPGAPFKLEA